MSEVASIMKANMALQELKKGKAMTDLEKFLQEVKERVDPENWEKLESTSEMMIVASAVMAVDVPKLIKIIEILSEKLQDESPEDWVMERVYPAIWDQIAKEKP